MNRPIKAYRVVERKTATDLAEEVSKLIKYDWQPLGGVSITMRPAGILGPEPYFAQAMVKYRKTPSDEGGPV